MEQNDVRNFLPDEYTFAHDYCLFLHDILASIVVQGEQKKIFHYQFALKDPRHSEQISGKSGEELVAWMEQNDYKTEMQEVSRRNICVALLSDFCHFIFEALSCSRKGKMTVAFALLRKPLKENLFYFEWLLADPKDFINRFHTPILVENKRPLPLPTQLSKDKRLEIIGEAIANSRLGTWITPEFIYELRYDKDCSFGFEQLFQKANHLITTFTARTEEQNFNFIFSGEEDCISQWQGFYSILPTILLHSIAIIGTVIRGFDDGKLMDFDFLELRANIGYLLFMQKSTWSTNIRPELENLAKAFTKTDFPCLGCEKLVSFDNENLINVYLEGEFKCPECGFKTLLTTDKKLLLLDLLAQQRVNCPNCDAVIEATKENLANFADSNKVICQVCKEEIELLIETEAD
jgi:hypothetical protein